MGAWVGAALTGLSLLNGLFGKKQHNEVDKTTTNTPTYDPQSAAFKDYLMKAFQGNLENNNGFDSAYTTGGLNNIRRTADMSSKGIGDILTSRGLSRTGAGASALADSSYRSGGLISSFLANAPLALDARRQNLLNSAGGFFSSLPVGSTSHVTGYDDTSQGGGAGGAIQGGTSGLAGFLGQLSAQNALKKLFGGSGSSSSGGSDWYGG